MEETASGKKRHDYEELGGTRRIPVQKRGRERVEKILAVATELIAEKGSEALKMSDIVERAGVSFGSLYQYFPDKTAIVRTLAEHYNALGRQCVATELAGIGSFADLDAAMARIVDGYFEMFCEMPVMVDIWNATQVDRQLAAMDAEDGEWHSQAVFAVLKVVAPAHDETELLSAARLSMQLLAGAVRYAILLEKAEGERTIALYKRTLPGATERLLANG
jgi:AcrR family transcriptional regulator